ncbi:MAG: restriction endonuclease [Sphingomonadales bacterium]|nr:MAG: restriction endonuclease [Sphingomonadales bacterium]
MALGVFVVNTDAISNDRLDERYRFPLASLDRARACLGDHILYYEPVKTKRTRGYFAVARLREIIPDPVVGGMQLAVIEPGSFLEFAHPVARADAEGSSPAETAKPAERVQAVVRPMTSSAFNRIIELGFDAEDRSSSERDFDPLAHGSPFLMDEQSVYQPEPCRVRVDALTSRVFRNRAFRTIVLRAYGGCCALTGWRFAFADDHVEAQAAHIRPVEANGPDILTNGLALSATIHWMFDSGAVSLTDDLNILVSRQVNDPDSIWELVNENRRAVPPLHATDRPHPRFLAWHREHRFKR